MDDDNGVSWSNVADCGKATFSLNLQPDMALDICDFCTAADSVTADTKTVTIAPTASTAVGTYKFKV